MLFKTIAIEQHSQTVDKTLLLQTQRLVLAVFTYFVGKVLPLKKRTAPKKQLVKNHFIKCFIKEGKYHS